MTRRRFYTLALICALIGAALGLLLADVVPLEPVQDINAVLVIVLVGWGLKDYVRAAIERRRARRGKSPKRYGTDPGITGELVVLLERMGQGNSPTPGTDMLRAWEIVFGRTPDLTRPMDDILEELTTAVNAMTSPSEDA